MRHYYLTDVSAALAALGIARGDHVIMHASLIGLGKLGGHDLADAPRAIVQGVLDHLGPSGTLAVPAFNFDFCKGVPFDRERTPCLQMGQLAELVRTWAGSKRSRHPAQSIAAVGARTAEFCDDPGEYSFAPGSAFARMHDANAWVLLLGVDFQAASLIHSAEERVGVPYRYWKAFHGDYIDGNVRRRHTAYMYVRDLRLDPQLSIRPVELALIERGQLRNRRLGAGQIRACRAQDLVAASEAVLRRDPMCLVRAFAAVS